MTIDGLEPLMDTRRASAIEVAYGRLTLQEAHERYEGMLLLWKFLSSQQADGELGP